MKNNNYTGVYVANKDMPIKYTYSLGGGLKGRTIKAGETVTVSSIMNDIDSQSVATIELLHRISLPFFIENFKKIK